MKIRAYISDIMKRIQGGRVLDVGCLGSYEKSQLIRHNYYKESAGEIYGIDYEKSFLQKAIDDGAKNLYYCDVTNIQEVSKIKDKLGTFKHIIATDIIEHIDKVGLFLQNMITLLDEDGSIYMTTPNVRSPYWFSMFVGKTHEKINADHMCWYEPTTLSFLLKRYDLKISELMFCTDEKDKKAAKRFNLKYTSEMGRRMYAIIKKEVS